MDKEEEHYEFTQWGTGCISEGKNSLDCLKNSISPVYLCASVFGCVGSATEVSGFFRWLGVKWTEGQTQTDTQNTLPSPTKPPLHANPTNAQGVFPFHPTVFGRAALQQRKGGGLPPRGVNKNGERTERTPVSRD